eukprot:2185338-Rhodomonas_salina.1
MAFMSCFMMSHASSSLPAHRMSTGSPQNVNMQPTECQHAIRKTSTLPEVAVPLALVLLLHDPVQQSAPA